MATTTPVQLERIRRYGISSFSESRDSKYCLLEIKGLETESDGDLADQQDRLMVARTRRVGEKTAEIACNLPGCDLTITEDLGEGKREQAGTCMAASYCLKAAFEESGEISHATGDTTLYRKIMEVCDRFASKHSAGNFCPRPGCDLSAGFSIDGVGGTAGQCLEDITQDQLPLNP